MPSPAVSGRSRCHPHVAKLLDAGASAYGLACFEREYVAGQPIDYAVKGRSLE